MTAVQLGISAYRRNWPAVPEVRLENRWVERNPSNLREHVSLIARPGTSYVNTFPGDGVANLGPMRGQYAKDGLFVSLPESSELVKAWGDLFVVSGANLYRYNSAGTIIHITGTVYNHEHPFLTWMKGIGYEYLFISDGTLLQYYAGGTHATGTLTGTPASQVVDIGGVYYTWNASVDAGSPAGTSSNPWRVNPLSDAFAQLAKAIMGTGVAGTDYSTALTPLPNVLVTATAPGGPPATSLIVTSIANDTSGNSIATTIFSGSSLSWSATTLLGGGVHQLVNVPMPNGDIPASLTNLSQYVLVGVANTQKFYWLRPGEVTIDPLDFAEKESNPDPLVEMQTVGDQALLMGTQSTENWYATGDLNAPLVPQEGRVYQRGVWPGTSVVVGDAVVLVGDDGKVYEIGYQFGTTAQWGVHPISDNGIEERIRRQRRREAGLTP